MIWAQHCADVPKNNMNLIEVLPAIIPESLEHLERELGRLRGGNITWVQVDFCDGRFVDSRSWPFGKDGHGFQEIVAEEQGLPFWDDFVFEADLMVREPARVMGDFLAAGFSRIVIHLGSGDEANINEALLQARDYMTEVVIAVGREHTPKDIERLVADIAGVQIMGIDHIGRQGEPFDTQAIAQVSLFRDAFPELPISVDGGVNTGNARALYKAGATRLVAGSAILGTRDPLGAYEDIVDRALEE